MSDDRRKSLIVGNLPEETVAALKDAHMPTEVETLGPLNYALGYDEGGKAARDAAEDRIDKLETALERIQQWSEAYPLDIFPEPDFKRARELLQAGGMTLDAVSASCMRHVIEGVGKIAREALSTPDRLMAGVQGTVADRQCWR